jgi:hypothetical protein
MVLPSAEEHVLIIVTVRTAVVVDEGEVLFRVLVK